MNTNDRLPTGSRKRQIVETVLELVAAQGTEAVSFQLIADAIGVTQPAVLRHFPTKEAMWLAVMDWLEEQLVAIYTALDEDPGQSSLVVLGRMFLGHVRLIERYPALAKLVFSDHLRLQYPSLQARFSRIHQAYSARLRAVLDRAKAEGVVRGPLHQRMLQRSGPDRSRQDRSQGADRWGDPQGRHPARRICRDRCLV